MHRKSGPVFVYVAGISLVLTACGDYGSSRESPVEETTPREGPAAVYGAPDDALEEFAAPRAVDPGTETNGTPGVQRRPTGVPELNAPLAELGARLFRENRLSNPGSQYLAACTSCHRPPEAAPDPRAYADNEPLSLIPATGDDMKQLTYRNTPTLLDSAVADRFNWDGGHDSLEELLKEKILGRQFGWLADQRQQAVDEIHALVLNDIGVGTSNDGRPYLESFAAVYGVDLSTADGEAIVDAVVHALSDYVRLLRTTETSPYDALAQLNGFDAEFKGNEGPIAYSERLFNRILDLERRSRIEFPEGIDPLAYEGFKTFMRTEADGPKPEPIGNCVVCHRPPKFSDFQYRNTGISQLEYDAVHGEGTFAALAIPGPDVQRPIATFAMPPQPGDPSRVDLGHWNHVALPSEGGGTDTAVLARAVATFKTPPLRNLDLTEPYMHNGQYGTIEDVIRQKIQASRMAKEGALVNPDPALLNMQISEDDVAPLAAFLRALNEMDAARFREVVADNASVRP